MAISLVQTKAFSFFEGSQDPRYQVVTHPEALTKAMNCLRDQKIVAFDYETSGVRWWSGGRPIGVAFTAQPSPGEYMNWYIPYRHKTGQQQLEPEKVIAASKEILEDEGIAKIAHNIKFDEQMGRADGIILKGERHDTMIQAHLFNENELKGLKHRALHDLKDPDAFIHDQMLNTEIERLAKWHGLNKTDYRDRHGFEHMDIFLCGQYGAHDAQMTFGLHDFYKAQGVLDYWAALYATEMGLTEVLADMEWIGVPIDVPYLQKLRDHLFIEKHKAESAFFSMAQCDHFNLGSDDMLAEYLVWKGCQLVKQTKSGKWSTDEEVISSFKSVLPELHHLLRWKEVDKKLSTYVEGILALVDENGILHGDFQQVGTVSGRLACKKPNLQNMPSDDYDRAKANGGLDPESIKRAFIVARNYDPFFDSFPLCRMFFDYSQVELRVLAWYTQDPGLVSAYAEGRDIHTEVEFAVFGTKDQNRRIAKIINFGLTYCMTTMGLARQAKISEGEAQMHFDKYYESFPKVSQFREQFWAYAENNGCQFNNLFGRTRRVPELASWNKTEKNRARRRAIASLIQGTAAELTKAVLVSLFRYFKNNGYKTRPVQTVHDEVQFDGPREEFIELAQNIKYIMEDFPQFTNVPIEVGGEVTITHWADKHEIPGLQKAA